MLLFKGKCIIIPFKNPYFIKKMSNFIDEANINVQSGNGGKGCISFRREKFVPFGGPNGGDGGKGGDIVFVTNPNLSSLQDFRYKKKYRARNGENGRSKNQHGKNGEDLYIPVPVGTILKNIDTGEIICDLNKKGQEFRLARGGNGGRGNARFATSTNQAPRIAQPGQEGTECNLKLELKLLADVGIVGFPNAGKSTLISKISAAKPKIADYPFTTIIPNLGVVTYKDGKTFVIADIPGIIEGAHKGAGLGIKFLKHIERTKLLVHMLDISQLNERDPIQDYIKMNNEMASFSNDLKEKPQIVVLNKTDIVQNNQTLQEFENYFSKNGISVLKISAITGEGVQALKDTIVTNLERLNPEVTEDSELPFP